MTQDQIAAYNQAVADFTAGQGLQQAGDNAGALAKYQAALPAIRTAVQVKPADMNNVNFLASTLYVAAAAQGALGNFDAIIPLYEEAAPLYRQVTAANPADAQTRNILAGMLVQLGNAKLTKQDKAGAAPYYSEAKTLAQKSVTENAADKISANILLSAMIGQSQTSEDPTVRQAAVDLGKKMIANGTIDQVNKPSIDIMTGGASAS